MEKRFRIWNGHSIVYYDLSDKNLPEGNLADAVWMQRMPVADFDGKDIYEGDVVVARRRLDNFSEAMAHLPQFQPYDEYRLVEFKVDTESVSFFLLKEVFYNERGNPCQWRLVGNIYENPELKDKLTSKQHV